MRPTHARRLKQSGDKLDDLIARLEDLAFDIGEEHEDSVGEIVGFLQDARYKVNDILPEPA